MNENKVIIPTVGRKLWLFIDQTCERQIAMREVKVIDDQPLDASVAYVHKQKANDYTYITVTFADHAGVIRPAMVPLRQPGQDQPNARSWCEWMPYQQGQAAKTEQAEAKAQAAVPAEDRALLPFGIALDLLKQGAKVARLGWNGKGLWLELQVPDAHSKMTLPYIFMSYPEDAANTPGARVPWLASQTDMLAEDWVVVA